MKKSVWISGLILVIFIPSILNAYEDLAITPEDILIRLAETGEGVDLFIRARPEIGSVLVTTAPDGPTQNPDSLALRAWDYYPVNGNEKRIMFNRFLHSIEPPLYYLTDSSTEIHVHLGTSFHIFLPWELTYGHPYPNDREGQLTLYNGIHLNIRTFERAYSDYTGVWADNPIVLTHPGLPPMPPESSEAQSMSAVINQVRNILENIGDTVDIVFVLDTTVSMSDDLSQLRANYAQQINNSIVKIPNIRVGLLLYRDYREAYLTRKALPFTTVLEDLQKELNDMTTYGGRDIPEAVNEGLYAALRDFSWKAPDRLIIQVGDAPAHSTARGAITTELVDTEAQLLNVKIYSFELLKN